MLDTLRRRNHVLPHLVLLTGLSLTWLSFNVNLLLFWLLFTLTISLCYLEVVTQWSFRAPRRRKPPLEDSMWTKIHHRVSDQLMVSHHILQNPTGRTVFICHGWTSGSQRMVGRAQLFLEEGWNVILIDLPGHGESESIPKWNAELSSTLIIEVLNHLHTSHKELFGNPFLIFGHSMGGFISLRLSHRREELSMHTDLCGWIAESPMTGYSEIFDETCQILRIPTILRPIVLKKTMRHFNALNPSTDDLSSLTDVDCPAWGQYTEPTLLVQADPDERLGESHYLRLQHVMASNQPGLLRSVMMDDLAHSGESNHIRRDEVIRNWLDDVFGHSSA